MKKNKKRNKQLDPTNFAAVALAQRAKVVVHKSKKDYNRSENKIRYYE